MTPADLETAVDTALRQLPLPRAPLTLLPRVMAAARAWTERPWYTRAWFTWPPELQAALVIALMLLFVGSALLIPDVQAAIGSAASPYTSSVAGDITGLANGVTVTAAAARVIWRTLVEPFVPYVFGLVLLMGLACVAFGATLNVVVFGRTAHS